MSAHIGISFATLEHLGPILERSRQNCGRGHRLVVWILMQKSQKSHNIQFRQDKALHSNCLEKSRLALKNAQNFLRGAPPRTPAGLCPAPREASHLVAILQKSIFHSGTVWRSEVESPLCVPSQPQGGSVGRVVPTHFFCAALRAAGRSVGSTRVENTKISFSG